jgi:hypothetical protein
MQEDDVGCCCSASFFFLGLAFLDEVIGTAVSAGSSETSFNVDVDATDFDFFLVVVGVSVVAVGTLAIEVAFNFAADVDLVVAFDWLPLSGDDETTGPAATTASA